MSEYVEFWMDDADRLERLRSAFTALKHDKDADAFRLDAGWLRVFDADALDRFYWPPGGRAVWQHRPVPWPQRETGPGGAEDVRWDLFSMIDAFRNGEYDLLDCRAVGRGKARLELYAHGYPYGGAGCMVALVEAFGFDVAGVEDGTGFREYP